MATILTFRPRHTPRPLHELIAEAARLDAYVHYCNKLAMRIYIPHGKTCVKCNGCDSLKGDTP